MWLKLFNQRNGFIYALDSNSFLSIRGFSNMPARQISFPTSTARQYSVFWSPGLAPDAWNDLQAGIPGNGGTVTITDTNEDPVRLYEIRVNRP